MNNNSLLRNDTKITQKLLKALFKYNQETGDLSYNIQRGCSKKGNIAGYLSNYGYRVIKINGKKFLAHRIIYMYMKGVMPECMDHINHIRDDNRWVNLRVVSFSDNMKNQALRTTNTSGICGVSWNKKEFKWRAYLCSNYKLVSLGNFNDFFEACSARKSAELKYGFHENHGRKHPKDYSYAVG